MGSLATATTSFNVDRAAREKASSSFRNFVTGTILGLTLPLLGAPFRGQLVNGMWKNYGIGFEHFSLFLAVIDGNESRTDLICLF